MDKNIEGLGAPAENSELVPDTAAEHEELLVRVEEVLAETPAEQPGASSSASAPIADKVAPRRRVSVEYQPGAHGLPTNKMAAPRPPSTEPAPRPSTSITKDITAQSSLELDEIKALTMHRMVESYTDGSETKKLIFFTNHQASLFKMENISMLLEAFEFTKPKLVISFMPCSGGTATIDHGMLRAFKDLNPLAPSYTEDWKKLLGVQAANDPNTGIVQDVLPIPPFLEDEDLYKAEWKVECFMRDVLVPLAAETSALIIGSAFKDASLMMMFARVAESLDSKYGGVGSTPWTMLGLADAPSLNSSIANIESSTFQWYSMSPTWQHRFPKIARAKLISDLARKGVLVDENGDGEVDSLDSKQMKNTSTASDNQILYDLNGMLRNIIIVDCVMEKDNRVKRIDCSAQNKLESILMDHLVVNLPVIGVGAMHSVGGYAGLVKASNYLNMTVPILLLDVRERKLKDIDTNMQDKESLLQQAVAIDDELSTSLAAAGKADIYEICRVAHFHSLLLQDRKAPEGGIRKHAPLYEAIEKTRELTNSVHSNDSKKQREKMLNSVTEHCLNKEFQSYWSLLSTDELQSLKERGITDYKQKYGAIMAQARTAYYNVLSSDLLYTAHANDLADLAFLVNHVLMNKERLPSQDSLDGLLVMRAAWDVIDIGQHQIHFFKCTAKICYVLLLLLGVAIVTVTVQSADIDIDLNITVLRSGTTLKGSQLITFVLSIVSSFVAAVQAFYNPVRRWQQVRDATAEMTSNIWQYRTRTGAFAQGSLGSSASTQALAEAVRKCREAIMVSADVQETSFHRFYGPRLFTHGQRPGGRGSGSSKVTPTAQLTTVSDNVTDDVTDPEAPALQEAAAYDNHYSPTPPDDYLRLRILKMLRFYRKRLPRYARGRDVGQWTIMIGTVVGALVAFLGFAPQVAIITSTTAAVSAWMEFHSTAQKVSRYNGIIVALSNILLWWDSLGPVDKASPLNIDMLVQMGEATLNAERGAWLSAGAPKGDKEKKDKSKPEDPEHDKAKAH